MRGEKGKISKGVKIWLWIGFVMILLQILIGGVTRLTGSGLSITKWEILTGTIPPLNEQDWNVEFDAYKETPQYHKINKGMSLKEFKFIYFWEYFHRLWARLMGFVFLLPAVFFWWRGHFPRWLKKRVVGIFLLAALVASFGWIMVASGLIDRPWVSAYRLSFHLILAVILLAYLLWTILKTYRISFHPHRDLLRWAGGISVGLFIQIFLGGMMSGMKAALLYPTFPLMNKEWIPAIIFNSSYWKVENFILYENSPFFPALVHTVHRFWAYFLTFIILLFLWKVRKLISTSFVRFAQLLLISLLVIQIFLGIMTVLHSTGTVPVFYGVAHQIAGILLFNASLIFVYVLKKR